MNKQEFIEKLQHALAGGLSSSLVADNVRYYQDYIETEIRKGKSEQEVLAQLGEPRLLAKSIIEANKRAGASYGSNQEYDEEVANNSYAGEQNIYDENYGQNIVKMPRWLTLLIIGVIALVILGVVTSLLSFFSPVIIVVLLVILFSKIFKNNAK